jgi:hypothetical protein
MFRLEVLPAKHGDALLLHFGANQLAVIDGGPATVYNSALKPRLDAIRAQRRLAEGQPLDIELMMVSHIDADHITGLLELTRLLKELRDSRQPLPWRIKRFWHNGFDDVVAADRRGGIVAGTSRRPDGAAQPAVAFAADAGAFAASATLTPASVKQGRELANLLPALRLHRNKPFGGLVQYRQAAKPIRIGKLALRVIGPNAENIALLRRDWAVKVVDVIRMEKQKGKAAAIVAAYVDESPYNLASIVVLASCEGKTMLLTGDGRGDHTLAELKKAGLLKRGRLDVDLLKLPHHGSSRNVEQDYFDTIQAKHYVISADGNYSNPDVETLKMISRSRRDDDFTIYLTYPFDEWYDRSVGKKVDRFFKGEKAKGRRYRVVTRRKGEPSITVAL